MTLEQSSFSGMMVTVGRLVRIVWFAGSEVINEAIITFKNQRTTNFSMSALIAYAYEPHDLMCKTQVHEILPFFEFAKRSH